MGKISKLIDCWLNSEGKIVMGEDHVDCCSQITGKQRRGLRWTLIEKKSFKKMLGIAKSEGRTSKFLTSHETANYFDRDTSELREEAMRLNKKTAR